MKWINALNVICKQKVPLKLKGMSYKIATRQVMIYDTKLLERKLE